ncbi:MAG: SRPBCC family protein [Sporichthyaceae bacterium]|nr:SRPBCC family protein [Sporichthyaceae bacterium]
MPAAGQSPKDVTVTVEDTLPGPPALVWRLITDWERQGDWMLEARDFVVTSPHREGVGVEAEATVRIGGLTTRDRVRVIGWEPPRRLEIEHLGWVVGTGELVLHPVADGTQTRLVWRESFRNPRLGFIGRLGLLAFRPLMRRIFRRDVRALAELVRAASGSAR